MKFLNLDTSGKFTFFLGVALVLGSFGTFAARYWSAQDRYMDVMILAAESASRTGDNDHNVAMVHALDKAGERDHAAFLALDALVIIGGLTALVGLYQSGKDPRSIRLTQLLIRKAEMEAELAALESRRRV